jgi:TPR repeat protein
MRLLRLAGDQGNTQAQYDLGVCYEQGIREGKDAKMAVHFYRLAAADQGSVKAQFALARCYNEGIGVGKDSKEAEGLCWLAANQGHAEARFILAYYYEKCLINKRPEEEALYLYRLSSSQGIGYASFVLSMHYMSKIRNNPENVKEMVRFAKISANQGYRAAKLNLSGLYKSGFGVRKDLNESQYWQQKSYLENKCPDNPSFQLKIN